MTRYALILSAVAALLFSAAGAARGLELTVSITSGPEGTVSSTGAELGAAGPPGSRTAAS
jgi:hypothetical protein